MIAILSPYDCGPLQLTEHRRDEAMHRPDDVDDTVVVIVATSSRLTYHAAQ